jgi:hypothetical protein
VDATMTKVDVFSRRDGNCLGGTEVDWDRYEAWSRQLEGTILAGEILDRATIAHLRITGMTAVWLVRNPHPAASRT